MTTPETIARRPAAGPRPGGGRGVAPRRAFTGRRALTILAFLAPAAVFVGIFTYYPLLTGAQMAFRDWNLSNFTDASWVGLDNFRTVLHDPVLPGVLRNTVIWVVGSLVPQFVIGFAIALWLRRHFRFRGLYQALIFYPWAVSGFLIGILFRWMFNGEFGVVNDLLEKVGLIDSPVPWLAQPGTAMVAVLIANIWYGVTFFAIMILAALQSVPDEILEAAALDGAGRTRTLLQIVVPYIRVTLTVTVLLRVIWIFNFPDIIYGMTGGGPADKTHIVTTWLIQVTQRGDYGVAAAIGLMVLVVLLMFSVFYLLALRERGVKR